MSAPTLDRRTQQTAHALALVPLLLSVLLAVAVVVAVGLGVREAVGGLRDRVDGLSDQTGQVQR